MKGIFKKFLKRIWHDFYLAVSFTILRPLAITCRQTTDFRNTEYDQSGLFNRIKYYLHLSICDGCNRYLNITEYFEKTLASYDVYQMSETETDEFNKRLLRNLKK